jgi:hypothetical protein
LDSQLVEAYLEIHLQLSHQDLEMHPLEPERAFSQDLKQPARSLPYLVRETPKIKISQPLDNYLAPKLPQVHKDKACLELSSNLGSNQMLDSHFLDNNSKQQINQVSRLHNLDQLQLSQQIPALLAPLVVLVANLSSGFLEGLNKPANLPCFQEEPRELHQPSAPSLPSPHPPQVVAFQDNPLSANPRNKPHKHPRSLSSSTCRLGT